jgi:cytochrome c oxidase subunit 4
MSTVIEPTPTVAHDGHEEADAHVPGAHKSTGFYIKVAVVLAVMTAIETSTYWWDFGPFFMPVLLIFMTLKFFTVVSLFMHLKYDNRLFALLFYTGLFLAIGVYVAALATFKLFASH